MLLKLPFAITTLPVFPKDREFTDFEAFVDLLINGHDNTIDVPELSSKWMWPEHQVATFIDQYRPWLNKDIYEDELNSPKAIALEVVDVFNQVFNRKVQLNDYRIRTIYARVKEGKKLSPPIGTAQFKAVFEFKKQEWEGTEQEKFLTIETLCAAKHFLKYLEAAREDFKKKKTVVNKPSDGTVLSGSLFQTGR